MSAASEKVEGFDPMWRWQTGGVKAFTDGQLADADAVFSHWIKRTQNFRFKGVEVRNFHTFVDVVQQSEQRNCGLEKYVIEQDQTDIQDPRLKQLIQRTQTSLANFLTSYQKWDALFDRLKIDDSSLPFLELSEESVDLDRKAWLVCRQSVLLADICKRLAAKISCSPLAHPFLHLRARQWVVACLLQGVEEQEIPEIPDPFSVDIDSDTKQEWLENWGANYLVQQRRNAGKVVTAVERAEMMRWLERFNMLEEDARNAESVGAKLSATSRALGIVQRDDLRNLRSEMASMFAVRADIVEQKKMIVGDHESDQKIARIINRLDEMHSYHFSKALFLWAKSFHFEPDIQTEAAVIAPKLIATARAEFAHEVDQTSSEITNFMIDKTESERENLLILATASQELARSEGITGAAKRLIEKIINAGRLLGAEFLADMRGVLPAIASETVVLAQQSKSTRLELLNNRVDSWQLAGLAQADRQMRQSDTRVEWSKARESMINFAGSIARDQPLLETIRTIDPPCAVWIEHTAHGVQDKVQKESVVDNQNQPFPTYTPQFSSKGK